MNVLIIGSGGREHALAWKAAQSSLVDHVFVAPGNAGTALEENLTNVDLQVNQLDELLAFAQANAVGLTIVGPEAPLVDGVVDLFQANGQKIFGPSQAAAQLEGSKAFTKDFLARHNIPTAAYGVFTEVEAALAYLAEHPAPIVIKADGLAAGKGVILAQTDEEAAAAVEDMLSGNAFGEAGHRVIIEEFLYGEEASFICMIDGKNILPMATSQDHKARDNGDSGPNTGGMGAYSPAPVVTDSVFNRLIDDVIRPTVDGMAAEGHPFTGFLYAGAMVSPNGDCKVLEYNVRFGDPETQPIMIRLKSDLVAHCLAALEQTLDQEQTEWDSRCSLGVVLAAGGYPEAYQKGDIISGLEDAAKLPGKVFHAGTATNANDEVTTNGGRVLCAVGLGDTVAEAQQNAYAVTQKITWNDVYYRTDIGHRAINR